MIMLNRLSRLRSIGHQTSVHDDIGKHRKNCESCPAQVTWKVKLKYLSCLCPVCPVSPVCLFLLYKRCIFLIFVVLIPYVIVVFFWKSCTMYMPFYICFTCVFNIPRISYDFLHIYRNRRRNVFCWPWKGTRPGIRKSKHNISADSTNLTINL